MFKPTSFKILATIFLSALFSLVLMSTHFSLLDLYLIALQIIAMWIFSIAQRFVADGYKLQKISEGSLLFFITVVASSIMLIVGIASGLSASNCMILVLYPLFSALFGAVCLPRQGDNEDSVANGIMFYVLLQICLTLFFGGIPHQPKPWSLG